MKKKLLTAALLCAIGASTAHAMDVATYLAKAEALRARGMTAILSSDFRELQAEISASGAALRQERLAARRAGRRPAYCPPESVSFSREEIFAAMNAVPAPLRSRTQVRDALRAAFARRFPCPR
jgi:cell division protein FtsL